MYWKFITAIIMMLLCSCNIQEKNRSIVKYLDSTIKVDSQNVPLDIKQGYFPFEVFKDKSYHVGSDTSTVNWYSSHLHALKEPLLFNKKPNKEIFRFLFLRTFSNPIVVRIEKYLLEYSLTWKLSNGAGGYEPGHLTTNKKKKIDKVIWDKFLYLLKKADYWNLNTIDNDIMGADGSQWILEGVDNNRYHVVDRWSPEGGNYYECCYFLLRLTDLDIERILPKIMDLEIRSY